MCLILGYFLCLTVDGLQTGTALVSIHLCCTINFIPYEYYVIVHLVANDSITNCDFRDAKIDVGTITCSNCNRQA